MKREHLWVVVICTVLGIAFLVEPALAGPGGKIARAVYETFWGKVILFFLVLFFLPLILYVVAKEYLAQRRARRDLRFMAKYSALFDWMKIRERALDCFYRIHDSWSKEDMAEASKYMTDWYWQNQQLVYLDRWEREGLVNHCKVKKIKTVRPLLFLHRNDEEEHEGSMVVIAMEAYMQDYLARRDSGEVVEGSKKFKDVETVWSFTLIDGRWRVSNIEEDTFAMEYARMRSELPNIEETLLAKSRA
ncbi:MAG: TIM44-like domain-containing protein [Nitrospinaceae bacterium]|nr:Tim44 domain-containing protein [Nitrospinaceae bacterium]NIR53957.1 Tim44 domain-containing protein [Nitrospinaceae bacterium]NIS84375.1 Tim44 domain-containing protein [Nitrospinaceae bacterium]NIT81177.1 Tim44 domain-containing protein [Nitrospinaceae bacterium]NIU43460.1 Tim44 domain-containing protein [Nitrospinaceae bacterium]